MEYGTLVQIKKVEKIYESGEMDIITVGDSVFRILEHVSGNSGEIVCRGYCKLPGE